MALYVAATLLLLCQCFAGKRTRSEMDKVSKESCEGMRELLLPCACILSRGYAFGSLLWYVAATLLLLCQCFAGKRTRSEMDKVSKESCEGMRELLLPCACILSRVMHLVVCSCNFLTLLSRSLIIQQWCHHDGCLKIYFQVSCHGFMATLKAILPRLSSGSAGIVDLNPFKEYVKPFSREINATHDEQCYYKADWLMWSRWRFRSVRLVFVDAFTSL